MKLTNKFDYPSWVVKCCNDISHAPGAGGISVSLLPQNPQVRKLLLTKWDTITTDVSDYTARLFGIAWHLLAEKYAEKGEFAEKTLTVEVDGVKIVGRIDFYDAILKILWDYKSCKAYKIIFDAKDGGDSLWDILLNIYRYILRKNNIEVNELKIAAVIKDWSLDEALEKADYPQCDMVTIPIPVWSDEKIEAYIRERIRVHKAEPVPCSAEEMWEKPTKYAVYDPKAMSKAKRVLDTEEAAKTWIDEAGKKGAAYFIKKRPGVRTNCKRFCSVRSVCPWNIYKDEI